VELDGKVALVTGGGTGLGRVISGRLAREGMNVMVHYSRSESDARETVEMLRGLGVQADMVRADLGGSAPAPVVDRMVEDVVARFGRLDLLVNNAGATRPVPFPDLEGVTEADWDAVLNINTKTPFFATRAAARIMRRNGGGHVINTASLAGVRAVGGSSMAYAVSKAAMIHLTKCLAGALAPDVRVNAVAPGLLRTRWIAHFSDAQLKRIGEQTPLRKVTDLDDAASVYVMLARNESMTGQVISVDAGLSL
jgi:3-oxoacyl-[acyl-carrier protein] reductase